MDRWLGFLGALSAGIAVAAGAFGAHWLRTRLSPDLAAVYETAVRYQIYHALGLLFTAWAGQRFGSPWVWWSGWLFFIGTLLFSGSLYLLALTGSRSWGVVTPFGGVCFILGWLFFGWGIWSSR